MYLQLGLLILYCAMAASIKHKYPLCFVALRISSLMVASLLPVSSQQVSNPLHCLGNHLSSFAKAELPREVHQHHFPLENLCVTYRAVPLIMARLGADLTKAAMMLVQGLLSANIWLSLAMILSLMSIDIISFVPTVKRL